MIGVLALMISHSGSINKDTSKTKYNRKSCSFVTCHGNYSYALVELRSPRGINSRPIVQRFMTTTGEQSMPYSDSCGYQ